MEQFFFSEDEDQLNDYLYPYLKESAIIKSTCLAEFGPQQNSSEIKKINNEELNNHMEIGDQKVTKDNCKEEEIDRGNICIIDKQLFR
jgi:hypothetical protein